MKSPLRTTIWAIVGILLILAASLAAWAQEETAELSAPTALRVAVVDIVGVGDEYQALQDKGAELEAWRTARLQHLKSLQDYVFLSETHFNEVIEILNASAPLPEEKQARLDELLGLSEQNRGLYLELEAKFPRTTEETEKFSMLQQNFSLRQQQLMQLENSIYDEYQQQVTAAREHFMGNVEEAVTQCAQENGYDLVLDRAVVIYGGVNITSAIIDRLNPPAASADEEAGEAAEGQ